MMTGLFSFSVGKAQYLFLILLVLPAVFIVAKKSRGIAKLSSKAGKAIRLRTFFFSLFWICMVLALSEISFGTKKIPVQKSGSNITLVFDISYSMLALDAAKNLSRLEAAKIYSKKLVETLSGSSFSVVLAKGSGFTALSETEDRAAIINLIENLSPQLMTSRGSSLSKGIEAALEGLPENSAKAQYIWLFTDGDETDKALFKSLEKAAKEGIAVTIIGFGKESETEVTAGDGKTKVKTSLRSQNLREMAEKINGAFQAPSFSRAQVLYLDSRQNGSALRLMKQVKDSESEEKSIFYEAQNVSRHTLFIFLAMIFFMLGTGAGGKIK